VTRFIVWLHFTLICPSPLTIAAMLLLLLLFPQGTAWNSLYTNGRPITTPMFNADSDPGSISDAEQRLIISMWRAVAEYFAIWEVDVTTEDPGFAGLDR
jgi:hypothetical protein